MGFDVLTTNTSPLDPVLVIYISERQAKVRIKSHQKPLRLVTDH